jgi:NADH:ubiquinone oxidoreductase subunit F (NADH-binding)
MTVTAPASVGPRLLAGVASGLGPDLEAHLSVHGPLPSGAFASGAGARALFGEVARSGLTGRGGAGFPTAAKLELLARQRRRGLLLVNAMEGEPASGKDAVLLGRSPHLVLDGAQVAAALSGAEGIVVCVAAEDPAGAGAIRRAVAERERRRLDLLPVRLEQPPGRYAAGEESALADWVGGGRGLPAFRPDKSVPLSVRRRPALVQNAETMAQLALVARHGADWFRTAGLPDAPGTALVTLCGAVPSPGVVEVELGTPLAAVLELGGWQGRPQGVLLGGYGGAFLGGDDLDVAYAPGPLAARGAGVGAGIVGVVPEGACGVAETARIVAYLAGQSAGQCGPCTFGLPALAQDLDVLTRGATDRRLLERLETRLGLVEGRGACRLPDGAVRLVRSALVAFGDDVAAHARRRPCPGWNRRPLFPTPAPGPVPLPPRAGAGR